MANRARKGQRGSFVSRAFDMFKTKKHPVRARKHYQDFLPVAWFQSVVQTPGKPVWMLREYGKFADEAYARNVVAHRAISLISQAAASVPWKVHKSEGAERGNVADHPLLDLLTHPNPCMGSAEFFESLYAYRLISGNAYIQALGLMGEIPQELHLLRPDRVSVIAGEGCLPEGYRHTVGDVVQDFPVDQMTGQSAILHLKTFHPLNDWYGLSPIEAAAYSIDQHNQAAMWNQALLQNGARPSGALVVKSKSDDDGVLADEQYTRLRNQIDEQFSGSINAGRPLLLEGGMEWKEMSLSPKDMDFLDMKHSAARDIALAFGVPPQLLGIPGDNTYSNLVEARLALWEQTVLPLVDNVAAALNNWLVPMFREDLQIRTDKDQISALAPKRDRVWDRLERSSFLTVNEKREAVGLSPIAGADDLEGE